MQLLLGIESQSTVYALPDLNASLLCSGITASLDDGCKSAILTHVTLGLESMTKIARTASFCLHTIVVTAAGSALPVEWDVFRVWDGRVWDIGYVKL